MGDFRERVEERERRSKEESQRAFDAWLAQPMTRMAMSLIPRPEAAPEALETLMRSAFESGYAAGGGSVAMELIKGLMMRPPKEGL